MKTFKAVMLIAVLLFGVAASAAAWAHGGHRHAKSSVRLGIHIGGPVVFSPWHYPAYPRYHYYPYYVPRYYYAPAVVVPSAPPAYIERERAAPAPEPRSQNWWYYCRESQAYYPYVDRCPGGWERVSPQPPS
jgi:hypothetical protein